MSMQHKAFVFDYDAFQSELRRLLETALESGEVGPLAAFIESHRSDLRDPCEGEPLTDDWESVLETRDAHQYGDFALTRYYDPREDIGLGPDWKALGDRLSANGLDAQILLGVPEGPPDDPFDPGKTGSYFQSPGAAQHHLERIDELRRERADLEAALAPARSMFDAAVRARKGLYTTF